jgi:hypothetical protein
MKFYLDRAGTKSIEILHKYAGLNQNLFSLLINNELWFSHPSDFNDPYDCNLNYDLSDVNFDKVYSHLRMTNKQFGWGKDDKFITVRAKDICGNPDNLAKLLSDFKTGTVDARGISCFSESDSILLMWSHYADSHKGVCLTFDVEKDPIFFSIPYKVEYPLEYPKIDPFLNERKNEVQLIFATKSSEWSYEKEYRIIKSKDNNPQFRGAIAFRPEALTEIKFGYKATEESIKTIKNLVMKKYPHIKLYRSRIKKNQFGLEFYPLD